MSNYINEYSDMFRYPESFIKIKKNNHNKINRFKLRYASEFEGKLIPHMFVVKPSLNLFDGNRLRSEINAIPYYNQLNRENPEILKSLSQSRGGWLNYYLTNMLLEVPIHDVSLNTIDTNKGISGWFNKYVRHDISSRAGVSTSLTFSEDRELTVYKTMKAWYMYEKYVSDGTISPTKNNIINGVLDYATTIYYILTGADGQTIKYYAILVGATLNSLPKSNLSATSNIEAKEWSVPMDLYCIDDLNPLILMKMFNEKTNTDKYHAENFVPDLHDSGLTWVGDPIIKWDNRTKKLKLLYSKDFTRAGNNRGL